MEELLQDVSLHNFLYRTCGRRDDISISAFNSNENHWDCREAPFKLEWLDLKLSNIPCIPDDIEDYPNIEKINIRDSEVIWISKNIGKLQKLKILNANYCRLTSFTPDFHCLKNIARMRKTNIRNGRQRGEYVMRDIGDIITNKTCFNSIPEEIGNCKNLEDIAVWDNYLCFLPMGLYKLKNLRRLHISYNLINFLDYELGNLRSLTELYFNNNLIEYIPTSIGKLQKLKHLHGMYNLIKTIPIGLTKLYELKSLGLDNNYITTIPPEISKLQRLQAFTLFNNPITRLPQEIGRLRNLKTFNCDIGTISVNHAGFLKLTRLKTKNIMPSKTIQVVSSHRKKRRSLNLLNLEVSTMLQH